MRITITQPLFAWECLEDSPSLRTIREFLAAVPDARLLHALHHWRGRGRGHIDSGRVHQPVSGQYRV